MNNGTRLYGWLMIHRFVYKEEKNDDKKGNNTEAIYMVSLVLYLYVFMTLPI